jgi:hypothetical protein
MLVGRLEEFGGLWNCSRQLVKCSGAVGTTWATFFQACQLVGEGNTGKLKEGHTGTAERSSGRESVAHLESKLANEMG